jgi:hypothetical protein
MYRRLKKECQEKNGIFRIEIFFQHRKCHSNASKDGGRRDVFASFYFDDSLSLPRETVDGAHLFAAAMSERRGLCFASEEAARERDDLTQIMMA